MKLTINQLAHILELNDDISELKYFNSITVKGQKFLPTDLVLNEHLPILAKNRIESVNVFYTDELYKLLSKEFPVHFRKPIGKLNFIDMDRKLEQLDNINRHSQRKRHLKVVGDIYGFDAKAGRKSIVLEHDEELNYKKWNIIKRDINKNYKFWYRNSECPIIILVNLKFHSDAGYVERFKINTDLISILVSHKKNFNVNISPDFLPTEDVISVTDPEKLLNEYIETNARLIIIGETLDKENKEALLKVRKYDKFVRMIVVPELNHKNLKHFIKQVKLVYSSDRWS